MPSYENIDFRSFDDALEQKPDTKVVIGSGKGGVGKTTTNSGVLLKLEREGKDPFGLDLDGSPSLELLTAAKRPKGMESHLINPTAISSIDGYEIPIAQHSRVIPALHASLQADVKELMRTGRTAEKKKQRQAAVRKAENLIKKEYSRLADLLLPAEIDDRDSYLPMLRGPLQPMTWNMGVEMKNIATAVQLIELMANRRHLVFDLTHGEESVRAENLGHTDTLLLDTENANHLITLMEVISQFRIFLSTLSSDSGNAPTWVAANALMLSGEGDIFKKFYGEEIRKKPEGFFDAADQVAETLSGSQSFLIQTVNPQTAVTEQTLEDFERMMQHGLSPDFIAMTRWPEGKREQAQAEEVEADFLERLNILLAQFDRRTSYKRLMETGIQARAIPGHKNYEDVQHQNMRIIADAL